MFTSTPVTQAVEGLSYVYQLTATGDKVTFSLTKAPDGAALRGNAISWIPTAVQSRASNSFTVTATTPSGASATQSWTVVPNGTVRITHVDNVWNENGSTNVPFDWSRITSYVAALVPQPDGSFKSLSGSPGGIGEFDIPNVPAGYYWLRLGPRDTYWTSSSIFDVGSDVFAVNSTPASANSNTTFNFNFTSLDATAAKGWLQFLSLDTFALKYSGSTSPGSTTFTGAMGVGGNVDYSSVRNGFVMQYKPTALGSLNGILLGPELTLTNLSLKTGGVNTISGALNPPVPAFLNLSVEASAWIPLFDHVAPGAPNAIGGGIYAYAHPYTSINYTNSLSNSTPIVLIATVPASFSGFPFIPDTCSRESPSVPSSNGFSFSSGTTLQPMMTDVEAGTVQYSDPFPATWRRTFSVCQNASVDVPVLGTTKTQSIVLTNSQTTILPTGTVKPLISSVQNPKVNGSDLFTARSINSSDVTLSWNPPAIGEPFGYQVIVESPTIGLMGTPAYEALATLSTPTTSIKIPPDLLASGHTYLFVISSMVDGRANMETSPHRSSLPIARADLISAPLTIVAAQPN